MTKPTVVSTEHLKEVRQPIKVPAAQSVSVSTDIVMLSDPQGIAAESIRQLRSRLIVQHLERGRRAIAFCAPSAGAGCTFIAANLAVAFAQIGTRVLLVNGDMRGDGVDAMFGEAGAGLSDFLAKPQSRLEEVTHFDVLPSFSLMGAGRQAADAQELLSGSRFPALVNESVREFDLTIIDTPPANLSADAHRIATITGYAAVIGRAHHTYYNDVSELCRQLAADGVTVVGTVLKDG